MPLASSTTHTPLGDKNTAAGGEQKRSSWQEGVPRVAGGGGLLQHFTILSQHPANAEALKGLILQLAIKGDLTKNWRAENWGVSSASDFIREIKEYNAKKFEASGRRVTIPKGGEKAVLELPETWVQVKNHELFSLQKGNNPKDLSETKKKYAYQDIEALDRGNVRRYSNDEKAPKCSDDDILVVCDGSRSGLVLDGKYGIVGSTLAIIHTSPKIKDYIKLIFLQDFERANANMVGAAIPHLDTKGLLLTDIGLPPLEEQKAIVAVVNQLFAEVDELVNHAQKRIQLKADFATSALVRLTASPATETAQNWAFLQPHFGTFFNQADNIKKLRESILQLAVQGKLTAKWRAAHGPCLPPGGTAGGQGGIEHAADLLERIKAEKAKLVKAGKLKKEKPLPAINPDEIPYDLPEGWEWCKWVDLLGSVNYPMKRGPFGSSLRKDDFVESGIRVFEQYNPINDDPNWMRYFITEKKYETMKGFTAEAGDFLISCSGATLGRIVYLPEGTVPGIINQALLKLTLSQDLILPDYFLKLFRSSYIQELIWQKAQGMAQPNMVGVKELKNILIPLPSLEEQKAIVQQVNPLMALCDQLENEIATRTTTLEDWMKSWVSKQLN
jgi:type I restriction enzyme S subunit